LLDQALISVLTLGGTISMTGESGVRATLGAEALLEAVPQLTYGPPVRARSLLQIPGSNISFANLDMVAAEVRSELSTGSTGVVVVQGTDTLEETGFALDILLSDIESPIIITGAMRNPMLAGHDGPANIFAAVRSAASPAMASRGVTVIMNDTIHAACRVQKRHASRTDAFTSSPHGPLGWFQEGEPVTIDNSRIVFSVPGEGARKVRVPLMVATLDPDVAVWEAVIASNIDGLVVAGFGVGHVSEILAPLLIEASTTIPIVLATRTAGGSVHTHTYGFEGSERHLLGAGLLSAGWLDPLKARILMTLALRRGIRDLSDTFAPAQP